MTKQNSTAAAKLEPVADATTDDSRTEVDEVEARRLLNAARVELTWTGTGKKPVTVTIPKRRGKWSTDAAEAFEDEKYLTALRELIGPEGWATIKEICPDVDELNEFADYAGDRINAECVP